MGYLLDTGRVRDGGTCLVPGREYGMGGYLGRYLVVRHGRYLAGTQEVPRFNPIPYYQEVPRTPSAYYLGTNLEDPISVLPGY